MKTNFRKLQLFLAISKIDISAFYVTETSSHRVLLQGKYTPEIAMRFNQWKCTITEFGHIRLQKSNFTVILTD
jgi:hypothetical protein